MRTKLFEVRDRATFIPCFGVLMAPGLERTTLQVYENEAYLLRRSGFGFESRRLVMFGRLEEPTDATWDPHGHVGSGRTVPLAHRYVQEHWDELKSGDVIDVEFINGETPTVKVSERLR